MLRTPIASLPFLVLLCAGSAVPVACTGSDAEPVAVDPADDGDAPGFDDAPPAFADGVPSRPGADGGHGIHVVDAHGKTVGVVVGRGSADAVSGRPIYDAVTVFHPDSGLFFTIGMAEGDVRLPGTVFFQGSFCSEPVGVSAGGCRECLSGFGTGFLHGETWYRVRGGVPDEQASADATMGSGVDPTCVPHGTSSARVFPVDPVEGARPPVAPVPPLRFVWR